MPDVPYDEVRGLSEAALAAGIELVLLAAPSTTASRLERIAAESRGFVYGVTVMGNYRRARCARRVGRVGRRPAA